MISASDHENVAHSKSMDSDNETATVYALLAIASSINRLAEAVDNIAVELSPPSSRRR